MNKETEIEELQFLRGEPSTRREKKRHGNHYRIKRIFIARTKFKNKSSFYIKVTTRNLEITQR